MEGDCARVGDPYRSLEREPIRLGRDSAPILLTVISTEEEFDWSRAFDPEATAVESARAIPAAQSALEDVGVRPCWVVDYPVAADPAAARILADIRAGGRCEIGAHLHPWVSPPVTEPVSDRLSYPGNLPAELELAKLRSLTERIQAACGARPTTYQAGRYGFGPRTAEHLISLGYTVDTSASPPFDFGADGGPDYSCFEADPFWACGRGLLVVPITGAFVGYFRAAAPAIHRWCQREPWKVARAAALLARARAIERIRLSPEGFSLDDMQRLTTHLLARGTRVFALSFHSPSLAPGHTQYVRTLADRDRLLDVCRRYCEHFLGRLRGRSMTPRELREHLAGRDAGVAS
jgi:hypothetical protein